MRNATMTDSLYRWSNTILVCDRQAQTVDFFSRDTRYTGASHHDVVPSTFPRGDTAATIHWRIEIFFSEGLWYVILVYIHGFSSQAQVGFGAGPGAQNLHAFTKR